VIKKKNS